jgi:hypothetical protein
MALAFHSNVDGGPLAPGFKVEAEAIAGDSSGNTREESMHDATTTGDMTMVPSAIFFLNDVRIMISSCDNVFI